MSRCVLVFFLGAAILSASFADPKEGDLQSSKRAGLKKAEQDRLIVTIWPDLTRVHINEQFVVSLRVVNATEKTQSFKVMSCSWNEHWKPDNPRIRGSIWSCASNYSVKKELAPGEAYEAKYRMDVGEGPPLVVTSFRLGFTPADEKKTYWSNRVVLGIISAKGK